MIVERSGDLLEDDADVLVNPVNTVGVMGKGLALAFAVRYPEMLTSYRAAVAAGDLVVGTVHVWPVGDGRHVVNVPTKRHWRSRSRLDDVAAGIDALATALTGLGATSAAVPPLGCGLGGLAWDDVRPLLEGRLGALDGLEVRLYGPRPNP